MANENVASRETSQDQSRAEQLAAAKKLGTAASANLVDESEAELAEAYVLPGGEAGQDEANVDIIPEQADEFTCASCFMVRHRSQLAREDQGQKYCTECEG
ncbi:dUTPase [Arthrobacter sp. MYb211]|uniref:DUF4193 family protein n=1 Tax=Micrococcaceae TaxID=1268 RepID=UPI000CFB589D|nr:MULTISPECIES: DUF4193 family protein [unclassified Arthrobacter]PRA01434.1 dUTPase [Arthrobacter sp. MYb224]PRA06374.1 dUTPase [Arthrobacter sp. MYb229]PRA12689.1 dUTPase [Arthrobacter sp. MYb221]PRB53276.1 dUTPase [Arthrobacter sp. MYb216]PRC09790.1 dUTPase [Arthrobacter sp. MYb211]